MKKCILVLGMHRSGTSLLTGLLHFSGIRAGKDFLNPLEENPRGFFEIRSIYELNEEILKAGGTKWDMIKKVNLNSIENYKEKIKNVILTEFEGEEIFVLKDPRICVLFNIYLEVMKELNIALYPVIVHRNYAEIAISLKKRNSYNVINGYCLSKYYYRTIKRNLVDFHVLETSYDQLHKHPQRAISNIYDFVRIEPRVFNKEMKSFIDKNLKRSKVNIANQLLINIAGEMKYIYFNLKQELY